jgi:hypothetical protein
LAAWSFSRKVIWSRVIFCKKGHLQQNLAVFASNWRSGILAFVCIEEVGEWNPLESKCIWSQGIWTRGHLVAWSFSRVVIRSHGYLVAGHLVEGHLVVGHLVADHLVAGYLVALNKKSILTYLQK